MVPEGVFVRNSAFDFPTTVRATREVLTAVGQTIFAEIDQSLAARRNGLQLRPTTLFLFGSPKAGTPLMVSAPLVGLDLPLKMLVWLDDDGVTKVAYRSVAPLQSVYDLRGADEKLKQIDNALAVLLEKIVTE
jgi:uncharacterized protein (DUF302 family)